MSSHCSVNVFDYQNLDEEHEKMCKSNSNPLLKNDIGLRFDGKNHNWMILKQYLSIPFSYMTFVIKDKIENNDSY